MSKEKLLSIYNGYLKKAIEDFGFTFDEFWKKVCFFLDPHEASAEDYALVGKQALRCLLEERYDYQNVEDFLV